MSKVTLTNMWTKILAKSLNQTFHNLQATQRYL